MRIVVGVCTVFAFIAVQINGFGQEVEDSVENVSFTRKAFLQGIKLISTDPNDTIRGELSVDNYIQYSGRIIRSIHVQRLGFEKSIYDSAIRVAKFVSKVANSLHTNTQESTVRQHLFIKEDEVLNPHELADNERYLRDRDFILDSRIFVTPVEGTDLVDLTVITRDVFSLGLNFGGSIPSAPEVEIYDANLGGRGHGLAFASLFDKERTPGFGFAVIYRKSSILGSLADLELGYTQINTGYSIGDEPEYAYFVRITRPLVSSYSRWAGGLEISRNWSRNVYTKPDSAFLDYKYNLYDGWVGYNFGVRREIENRNRHFLAFRYFDGYYLDRAGNLEARDEIKYNNGFGYLSELTFYRQSFYKTRYVYGFGRTEDVPVGLSLGLAAGYLRLLSVERPYGSIKFHYGQASRKGNFYGIDAQTGGFVRGSALEDVVLESRATYFTRLWHLKKYRVRSVVSTTYTKIFNQQIIRWLKVNEAEIPGFQTDSLEAEQRIAIHLESEIFTPWSLLGFRMAPFAAVDMVPLRCRSCDENAQLFWGVSAGMRTRNENLIFGTLELKVTYIPKDEYGNSAFTIGFKQNLRVKNSGTYVKAPSLIAYN